MVYEKMYNSVKKKNVERCVRYETKETCFFYQLI